MKFQNKVVVIIPGKGYGNHLTFSGPPSSDHFPYIGKMIANFDFFIGINVSKVINNSSAFNYPVFVGRGQ